MFVCCCCCCFLFTFPVYEGFILLLTIAPVLSSTTVIAVFNERLTFFKSSTSNTPLEKMGNNPSYSELQKDTNLSKESSSLDSSNIQTGVVHYSSRRWACDFTHKIRCSISMLFVYFFNGTFPQFHKWPARAALVFIIY